MLLVDGVTVLEIILPHYHPRSPTAAVDSHDAAVSSRYRIGMAAERFEEARQDGERRQEQAAQAAAATPMKQAWRKLRKVLGMLGREHEGERAAATRQAEALRKAIGISWDVK